MLAGPIPPIQSGRRTDVFLESKEQLPVQDIDPTIVNHLATGTTAGGITFPFPVPKNVQRPSRSLVVIQERHQQDPESGHQGSLRTPEAPTPSLPCLPFSAPTFRLPPAGLLGPPVDERQGPCQS